jgi:copper resistance protein B
MKKVAISLIASLAAGTAATPALAQHAGHTTSQPQQSADQAAAEEADEQCALEAQRHRAMGHRVPEGACGPESAMPNATDHGAMGHTEMDHGAMAADEAETGMTMPMDQPEMDHSEMDQGQMDHGSMATGSMEGMDHSAMQDSANADAVIPLLPAPPEAGSGPARAAIAIWGAEAMEEAREALIRDTDGGMRLWVQGDRLEYRARAGEDGYLWDVQGYYGGDINKFWFKSEGEGSFGEPVEGAEVQALWSRAIAPFFDLQGGIRQDLTGPERTHAVIGIQGLVPYQFEVDAAAFVSNKGDVTARIEAEVDQRITQRLILQPRAEIALSAQDIPELGVGAGLDRIEAGLRLRYEFAREFAPYIGISQEWRIGGSADFARAEGEDPSVTNYVVGVRFWF